MIFLAITQEGLNKSLNLKKYFNLHIWCGSDVIFELSEIRSGISQFNYPLKGESHETIMDALKTIREHHPGKIIWVENNE